MATPVFQRAKRIRPQVSWITGRRSENVSVSELVRVFLRCATLSKCRRSKTTECATKAYIEPESSIGNGFRRPGVGTDSAAVGGIPLGDIPARPVGARTGVDKEH